MFFMKVVNIYVQNILFYQIIIKINYKLWTVYMYYTQIKYCMWHIAAVHSHGIAKREIENRCPCPECYQYHSSSSSVHSSNTTKSSDLFGDTSPISPSDAFLSPSPQSPRSGHGVHPSITRQSTNPLFGQNGNLSSNVNATGGWPSAKPFSEPSNIGRECNSSNQLTEQNRIRSLSQYNANGFPGRCECTCGIPGSPEEHTDHSSSAQSVSLTCLCPSSIISENTRKLIFRFINSSFFFLSICRRYNVQV